MLVSFQVYLAGRIRKKDPRFELLIELRLASTAIGGTRFHGAVLHGASFAGTEMSGVRLGKADLTRVQWHGTAGLDEATADEGLLPKNLLRDLLVSRHGPRKDRCRGGRLGPAKD